LNIALRQFIDLFAEYGKTLSDVEVEDAEYLAWISMLDTDSWPKEGPFQDARTDHKFRSFRAAYKNMHENLPQLPYTKCRLFQLMFPDSVMPFNKEFRERYLKENPEGVPF
jgi:hypothetical protein